ncbi:MAG: threonine--tRNA ligase [Patescibacteria group bacterium]|nr:threonine--tRNA ligase [Patescibacteria group bacterium]
MKREKRLEKIRHSLAHLLASAFLKLDPEAKLGIGPTTENGFYYDFLPSKKFDESILAELELIMKNLVSQNLRFIRSETSFRQAKKIFKTQPFKLELLNDLAKYGTTEFEKIESIRAKKLKASKPKKVTIYYTGDFVDLCRGGHVKSTREINPNSFRLIKIAGAYWRGNERNPMLLRIYGVAFETEKELQEYLQREKYAEENNHRVLGERLKIFLISQEVGKGLPILLPRGEKIKQILIDFMRDKEEKYGYFYVATPHLASSRLYELSGHLKYYQNEMYRIIDPEGETYFVKPMNCPHHHMVYRKLVKSYRDLPLKLAEAGGVYRFEKSGETYGLMRVRGTITQNDAHIYLTEKQLANEFNSVLDLLFEVYEEIKVIKDFWFRLSLPDFSGKNREKYGGDLKLWQWASKVIKNVCRERRMSFVQGVGEAAFYGPKLDMQIRNIFGKEETIATIQVDILVPKRMKLVYVDDKGKDKYPIIIHRAILGSYERFIGFLLEATAGNLPLWLAPLQVAILPVSDRNDNYAKHLFELFKANNIRTNIYGGSESLSKRIMQVELEKVPFMLVIGDREEKNGRLSIRQHGKGDVGEMSVNDFLKMIKEKIINKDIS